MVRNVTLGATHICARTLARGPPRYPAVPLPPVGDGRRDGGQSLKGGKPSST